MNAIRSLYTLLERVTPSFIKRLIPVRLRTRLGLRIKSGSRANSLKGLDQDPQTPAGETLDSLFEYLTSFYIESEGRSDELIGYLEESYRRFLYTLQIVPDGQGQLLEIGANPYYMSLLLQRFRRYEMSFVNYFESVGEKGSQVMVNGRERFQFDFHNVNIEVTPLPFPDNSFDVVLLCEVLEHFAVNPMYALLEIKRVMKPSGHLILTTPNVARLINVAKMISGDNIYDPFSGYGPYGRHNREYNCHELDQLLSHQGFEVEDMFTSDVHPNHVYAFCSPDRFLHLLENRLDSLGQYIFVRARNSAPANVKKPRWLYRSCPDEELYP